MGSSDLPQGLQVEPGLGSGCPGLDRSSWGISGRAALPAHLAPAPLLLCPQGASCPLSWGVPDPVSAMTPSSSLTHPTSALGEPAVGVLSGLRGRGDEPTRCTDGLMLGRISAAEGPAGAFPLSPVSLSGAESPQCQDLVSGARPRLGTSRPRRELALWPWPTLPRHAPSPTCRRRPPCARAWTSLPSLLAVAHAPPPSPCSARPHQPLLSTFRSCSHPANTGPGIAPHPAF